MGNLNIENQGENVDITEQAGGVYGNIGSNNEKGYLGEISQNTEKNESAGCAGNIQGVYGRENNGIPVQNENASAGVGVLPGAQGGYVGGFIGKQGPSEDAGYIGGFVSGSQTQSVANIGYDGALENEINPANLPVKIGVWSKIKSLLLPKNKELQIELSQKQVKVLSEVHDFLFQDMSIKGFMNILKIGKDKK